MGNIQHRYECRSVAGKHLRFCSSIQWRYGKQSMSLEPVSDDLTLFVRKNFHISKLNQSTRVVKIGVYYTIRPFKRTPGTKVDWKSLEFWIFSDKIGVKPSETSSIPSSSPLPSEKATLQGFKVFNLKARTRFWSWLSYMCHIRSSAVLLLLLLPTPWHMWEFAQNQ